MVLYGKLYYIFDRINYRIFIKFTAINTKVTTYLLRCYSITDLLFIEKYYLFNSAEN